MNLTLGRRRRKQRALARCRSINSESWLIAKIQTVYVQTVLRGRSLAEFQLRVKPIAAAFLVRRPDLRAK